MLDVWTVIVTGCSMVYGFLLARALSQRRPPSSSSWFASLSRGQLHAILPGHRRSPLKNSSFLSASPRHPSSSSSASEVVLPALAYLRRRVPGRLLHQPTARLYFPCVRDWWLDCSPFLFLFSLLSLGFIRYCLFCTILMMKPVETAIKSSITSNGVVSHPSRVGRRF